ncbi:MAG: hypothetical protein KDI69_03295 [Xanthomonadales bacterium]|nr:hypothetical protein [Xanthomonadales bacterium]
MPGIFPDWHGEIVVVAASGLSLDQSDLELVRGRARLIVINSSWKMAPWADALYGCDEHWWRKKGPTPEQFAGLRFIGMREFPGCVSCGVASGEGFMRWCGERLGSGWNSGFQALNLAAVSGARRVVLTGYDLQRTDEQSHWHGDHGDGLNNPSARTLEGFRQWIDQAAPDLEAHGVEVVNATRNTALRAYWRASMETALQ